MPDTILEPPAIHIEMPIYESLRESQLQHGLKYDDHRQYRSYCSRRLHRLRRSLNVAQNIPSTAKARHQRAKKLMDVTNTMVLEAGEKNHEYAQRMMIIPLLLAERAWSYSMQMKQEVSEYPRKRFHLVRRLKKAAEYATKFKNLVHDAESPCSERTKKEATAYEAYMNGLYDMERGLWSEAKDYFSTSLLIYTELSLSLRTEQMYEQYRMRIEEIRASLRYCAFNLGEKPEKSKTNLPSVLKFHDIAFRHAKQLQEELRQQKQAQQKQQQEQKEQKDQQLQKEQQQQQSKIEPEKQVQEAEEDENEFVEAEEADDDTSSEDDEEPQQTGGVTGLVKGWLGGAWSGR